MTKPKTPPPHKEAEPLTPKVGLGYLFNFEEGPFGSGLRLLIVAKLGRKWMHLLHPTTLEVARLPLAEFAACKARLPGPAMTNYTSARVTAATLGRYMHTEIAKSFATAPEKVKELIAHIEKEGYKDAD